MFMLINVRGTSRGIATVLTVLFLNTGGQGELVESVDFVCSILRVGDRSLGATEAGSGTFANHAIARTPRWRLRPLHRGCRGKSPVLHCGRKLESPGL